MKKNKSLLDKKEKLFASKDINKWENAGFVQSIEKERLSSILENKAEAFEFILPVESEMVS